MIFPVREKPSLDILDSPMPTLILPSGFYADGLSGSYSEYLKASAGGRPDALRAEPMVARRLRGRLA